MLLDCDKRERKNRETEASRSTSWGCKKDNVTWFRVSNLLSGKKRVGLPTTFVWKVKPNVKKRQCCEKSGRKNRKRISRVPYFLDPPSDLIVYCYDDYIGCMTKIRKRNKKAKLKMIR